MAKILRAVLLCTAICLTGTHLLAQNAKVLRSDLSIRPFYKFDNIDLQPRFVYDPTDASFYNISYNGELYHLTRQPDGSMRHERIATAEDHEINYLQGLAIQNGNLYLVGNVVLQQGVKGFGKAVKTPTSGSDKRTWTTVFRTAEHASSKTLFDHSFSSVCFSPDGKDMFVASGSRTDHGEIKDNEGRYPNLREIALTSCIFKIPANSEGLVLPNDSTALAPYVYARGVRNAFSLAFAPNGDLFSVENSGERDDPEEMNWIRQGGHYGFPWELGGNDTPMQFTGYDPETDKLLNHNYTGYQIGAFHNDPGFPKKPQNLTFRKPVQNLGPDADKYRDPTTGAVQDASNLGKSITSFTAHRSPLGLTFDTGSTLAGEYLGKGFVLSYQAGSASYGPMEDASQDLLMLTLKKNDAGDNYVMNAHQIAADFSEPTDARIVGNKMYILEAKGQMYEITFPKETITATEPHAPRFRIYPNPAQQTLFLDGALPDELTIFDVTGRRIISKNFKTTLQTKEVDISHLHNGLYIVEGNAGNSFTRTKLLISR